MKKERKEGYKDRDCEKLNLKDSVSPQNNQSPALFEEADHQRFSPKLHLSKVRYTKYQKYNYTFSEGINVKSAYGRKRTGLLFLSLELACCLTDYCREEHCEAGSGEDHPEGPAAHSQ